VIDLTPFADLIKRRCGLGFEDDRRALLDLALRRRMAETGLGDGLDYFTRLMASDREFHDLVSLLTINETYFFREPQHLTLLAERLVPRLLGRAARRTPLRILSAGCSTGEEPYSIAMALRERYGEAVDGMVRIVGGDIDRQALAKARAGHYSEFSFRGVAPWLRERHFRTERDRHTVLPAARALVEFAPLNLLEEAPPPGDPPGEPYDVIFLRNVTIYFDAAARRAIQARLRGWLRADGYLLVGMAETLANDFGLMALVQEDGLFYFAREAAVVPEAPAPPPRPPRPPAAPPPVVALPPVALPPVAPPAAPPPAPPPVAATGPSGTLDDAGRLTWERSYDRALALLDTLATADGGDPRADLLTAHILLNRKEISGAEDAARRALDRDPWSIDALLVLGLAARHAGRTADAIDWLRRAVYASHGCWTAHYYLGDLYRGSGEREQARSAYRVALRLLSRAGEMDTGLKVLLPAFPASDIRFLCEHHLSLMEDGASPPPRVRART